MRHYFWILLMTWTAMIFILVSSWLMLLLGIDVGDFTVFIPVILALVGGFAASRTKLFDEHIRKPLAETLDFGNVVEIIIHMQLFTLICGVLGVGLGIASITSLYPMGVRFILRGVAGGDYEWHNFTKYVPLSILAGFTFSVLFYSYLFADARNQKKMMAGIVATGFFIFLLLGFFFGTDRTYLVIAR